MTEQNHSQSWNAELYDDKHAFVWELGADLLTLLKPKPGERILDLGCGTGQLTDKIAESGANVIGVDHSSEMIDKAHQVFPSLQLDRVDAHRLPYVEEFDAIFSNAVLHWIKDPVRVVEGIAQSLLPGGRIVFEFGGHGNVRELTRSLRLASQELLGEEVDHPWYFPTIGEFALLLERQNIDVHYGALIDRPTELDGKEGLRDWIRMFGQHWLDRLSRDDHDVFLELAESHARESLYQDGNWFADYRRIRIAGTKTPNR